MLFLDGVYIEDKYGTSLPVAIWRRHSVVAFSVPFKTGNSCQTLHQFFMYDASIKKE